MISSTAAMSSKLTSPRMILNSQRSKQLAGTDIKPKARRSIDREMPGCAQWPHLILTRRSIAAICLS
jgi:hypothetical protein